MTRFKPSLWSVLLIFFLFSCQKEFILPASEEEQSAIDYGAQERIADSLTLNFLWLQPSEQYDNLIGARFELRNANDSLIISVLDIINQGDSVFQFYPNIHLALGEYKLVARTPTGMIIDTTPFFFNYEEDLDEIILSKDNVTYYLQFTWSYPSPFRIL